MRVLCIMWVVGWVAAFANAQTGLRFTSLSLPAAAGETKFIAVEISGGGQKEVVSVLLNPQKLVIRNFDIGTTVQVPIGFQAIHFAAIDIDTDGDDDVVACGNSVSSSGAPVAIFVNGGGTLTAAATLNVPVPDRISTADVDGDFDTDLVIGRALLINDGVGNFSVAPTLTAAPTATEFLPGDYDADGDTDLLALFPDTAGTGTNGRILIRTIAPIYTVGPIVPMTSDPIGTVRIADVNGDGRSDVVRAFGVTSTAGEVRTLIASGAFSFTALAPYRFTSTAELANFDLADVDGDAIPDFVGTARVAPGVDLPFVLIDDGTGLWNAARGPLFSDALNGLLPVGPFLATDMNGDGRADVVGRETTGLGVVTSMSVYTNSGPNQPVSAEPTIFYSTPSQIASSSSFLFVGFTLVTPAGTLAAAQHVDITVSVSSGNAVPWLGAGADHAFTNDGGQARILMNTGTVSGQFTVTATTPSGQTASTVVTVAPNVTALSGNLQAAHPGEVFAAPLNVRALPFTVATGPNPIVTFTSIGAVPVTFESPNGLPTNAQNEASIVVRAGLTTGAAKVRASIPTGQFADFDLTIGGAPLLTLVGPGPIAASIGEAIPPIIVHGAAGNGLSQVGATLTVTTRSGTVVATSPTVVTGLDGNATINLLPSSVIGASEIQVSASFGTIIVPVYVRGLTIVKTSTIILVRYQHEHPFTPLIVAADLPLAAPGYVASAFGNLSTSILSPDPAFIALDGLGVFGPADPSVITNFTGLYQRVVSTPPAIGATFVLQVYGYDVAYAFPGSVFISNPATLSL